MSFEKNVEFVDTVIQTVKEDHQLGESGMRDTVIKSQTDVEFKLKYAYYNRTDVEERGFMGVLTMLKNSPQPMYFIDTNDPDMRMLFEMLNDIGLGLGQSFMITGSRNTMALLVAMDDAYVLLRFELNDEQFESFLIVEDDEPTVTLH